jgi:hypothetical protein
MGAANASTVNTTPPSVTEAHEMVHCRVHNSAGTAQGNHKGLPMSSCWETWQCSTICGKRRMQTGGQRAHTRKTPQHTLPYIARVVHRPHADQGERHQLRDGIPPLANAEKLRLNCYIREIDPAHHRTTVYVVLPAFNAKRAGTHARGNPF